MTRLSGLQSGRTRNFLRAMEGSDASARGQEHKSGVDADC